MERLRDLVFMSLGEVSMCWSETPKGVFDSVHACKIGEKLMAAIEKTIEEHVSDEIRELVIIDRPDAPEKDDVCEYVSDGVRCAQPAPARHRYCNYHIDLLMVEDGGKPTDRPGYDDPDDEEEGRERAYWSKVERAEADAAREFRGESLQVFGDDGPIII